MPLPRLVSFDSFELDTETGELWESGSQLHLQEKPFEVLQVLLERAGDVVSRQELRERVWPGQSYLDFDHSINIAISKLRETLGDSADEPRYIETLPRRGYRFIAEVSGQEQEQKQERDRWRPRVRRGWAIGAVAGLFAVGGFLAVPWQSDVSPDRTGSESTTARPIESLAVLPLKNLSGDPGQEYLADGVTEAIISELGGIRAVRVISWQSVVQFKNSSDPLAEIGHLLDVEAVVLGGIRSSDDTVLVDVQLVGIEPERHLWTETYQEPREDLLELQQRVARAIAREIRVAITAQERRRLERPVPVVPAAYDSYLMGLRDWNRFSKEGFESAIEHFEHAVAMDPDFAAAYAGLANSWAMLAWYGYESAHEVFPLAEKAARRALELDPDSARAHNAMAAVIECYLWNFSEAEAHHLRAIELNPSFALAHNWYSYALSQRGAHEEAIESARTAQRLDPMSLAVNGTLGLRLYDARRFDEAIDQLLLTLEMNPHFAPAMLFLAMTYQRVGLYERALDLLHTAVAESGGAPTYEAALGSALAAAGRQSEAEAALRRALAASGEIDPPAFHLATLFAALDDFDRAFEWLETAYELRSPWMSRIAIEPLLDPLRDDPRFADLRRRVGM
jgi:TolB-like protein/DNA-binding winged helix-turn-helix (wHTH) protein/Flp pilus assembly protein TadD